MPSGYDEEIIRCVRRDAARKQCLYQGAAPLLGGFAFDSEIEQMTATEFATKVLRRLGLIEQDDTPKDPCTMLEMHLAGRRDAADRAAGRRPAYAQDSGGSFLDKYLA